MAGCALEMADREASCRDGAAAMYLKVLSLFFIFFASVIGIAGPVLLARHFHGKPLYDKAILLIKCLAAGVILSTSLVHVLPDAYDSLADCHVASQHPWRDFPFAGLVTLFGVVTALFVDLTASEHMGHGGGGSQGHQYVPMGAGEHGKGISEADLEIQEINAEELVRMKQKLVSQVLEIGIIFHSVIIGVTLGMSQNRCTIKPLVFALSFHQIFEGMGLGGCIAQSEIVLRILTGPAKAAPTFFASMPSGLFVWSSVVQAGFSVKTVAYMCFMFALTTPFGIILGMIVFAMTGFDDTNPNALIMEGLLGSLSSGILIYMALVDLIAMDFFHNKMMTSSGPWFKKASFVALLLGSASMSLLALWA